ncbi:Ldh family oxidoreductase [Ureibacillus aquaedulcis]|uniref:Ldh family oxidoreductase n=1 Tax=Ureibacillus aquaedulcis TaxID=3058421 RepID=A0ABT8GRC2_9BACL|nr:Ldh family oxidoreductase [Ureibacillus sp. BA0131]MDN4493496.1 Ldh family oxidoreductase [Ureibacillus sp. BA0131]
MGKIIIKEDILSSLCVEVFSCKVPLHEAKIIVDNLIEAELTGVSSHGVTKVFDYLVRQEKNLISATTEIEAERDEITTFTWNAHNGWGAVAGKQAMQECIERGKLYGVSFGAVNHSNHFGIASYYTKMAAKKDMIGFAFTNSSSLMVPYGGKTPSLGTNPICISIPTGTDVIVTLDMSTAITARGRINLAQKLNQKIPNNWAITADGNETTDPTEALQGYILPMGAKGSGLAIMVDIITGVLTGANFGSGVPRQYEEDIPQNLGHLFGTIDISKFIDLDDFYKNMKDRIDQIVNSEPMEGFNRVMYPGQIEHERKCEQLEKGIELDKEIYLELISLAKKYNVNVEQYEHILNEVR